MRTLALALALTLVAVPPARAHDDAPTPTTFSAARAHYAAIQQALAGDTTDGVADHAHALRDLARAASADFSAAATGIAPDQAAACRKLLPHLADAAVELAAAGGDLDQARTAFAPLSDAMISFRAMVPGDGPRVAYCPMARHSWLQDGDKIANPYYGKKMLRCGQFSDGAAGASPPEGETP